MSLYKARRIVTGHDAGGRSTVISDGIAENLVTNPTDPDRGHINFWRTYRVPADNGDATDPAAGPPFPLPPPKGGTLFRFFQIAPEKNESGLSKEERDARMAQMFRAAGAGHARQSMGTPSLNAPDGHAGLHRAAER